jgi:polar amino acid transport system substrate-binding protein
MSIARMVLPAMLACLYACHAQAGGAVCQRDLAVAYFDAGPLYDPATGRGIDPEVMEEIGRRIGCWVAGRFLSRGLIMHAFEMGKLDVMTSAMPSPERLRYGVLIPFLTARNVLVTKIGRDVHDTPEAFAADPALRLGIINRYLYGPGWEEWGEDLRQKKRVVVAGDAHQLMRLLDAGRIDAFPAIPVGSAGRSKLYGPHASLRRLRWFENSVPAEAGLLLARATLDESVLAAIEHALHDMREDGTVAAIVARYVPDRKEAEAMLEPLKGAAASSESSN